MFSFTEKIFVVKMSEIIKNERAWNERESTQWNFSCFFPSPRLQLWENIKTFSSKDAVENFKEYLKFLARKIGNCQHKNERKSDNFNLWVCESRTETLSRRMMKLCRFFNFQCCFCCRFCAINHPPTEIPVKPFHALM